MPRQDYSLPSVAPLPKLATPRPARPANTQLHAQSQVPQESDLVMVDSGAIAAEPVESDDEYDLLEDHCDILKALDISYVPPTDTLLKTSDQESSTTSTSTAAPPASSAFVDMLLNDAESSAPSKLDPNITTTENGAPTFVSSGDPRLDFFFEVLQGTEPDTVRRLVRESWAYNPLDTLRLIFQLRSIVHGKGEREAFYICMDFLREEHPQTLLFNLRFVPDHGYWKDLLNWLVFQVRSDPTDHSLVSRAAMPGSGRGGRATRGRPSMFKRSASAAFTRNDKNRNKNNNSKSEDESGAESSETLRKKKPATDEERQRAKEVNEERNQDLSAKARAERLKRDQERLERARTTFEDNAVYRAVHLEVARLFANALVRDKARLERGRSVSLAAKWCPSLNQLHDNYTLIATTIAQILFPEKRTEESHVVYVNRVRQQFRQQFYVPLRKATPVLETMMAAKRWDEIMYSRVPAIAMKNNKAVFVAQDKERFEQYLESIAKGETTIAAQALKPHQLVKEALSLLYKTVDENDLGLRTLEAQWKSYVERLAKSGTMDSAMAMCDVSGSMSGQPMEVAIALSLLLTQLSRPPYNRIVLTFSESPEVHHIKEGSLLEQVRSLRDMGWGMNTDLGKAFDHILSLSVKNNVAKEDMVKTLFIFSDMEFDQAVRHSRPEEAFTNYSVVKGRFEKAGYEMPQIVFWNLRGSNVGNKPAKSTQQGVAMVSGFSGMLMKLFLDGGDVVETLAPAKVMEKAINMKEFKQLQVLD
ncbi:hypothetical protein EDD21DRAFT_368998 [Dissophora ornata]|nr:hypothetical protein EDD21DRAFT_368998 [Dissophora ornata]